MASGSGSDVITVLSWNINGLKKKFNEKKRKTKLLEIFGQYDIVLLQETHIGKDDKTWENITKTLSKKYDLINLEDLPSETADNQEEEEEEEEEEDEEGEEEEEEDEEGEEEEEEEGEEDEEADEEDVEGGGGGGDEEKETMYMTNFSSDRKGVAILVNKPHTLLSSFSAGGDYAGVHVEIDGQKYTFVSVYYHKDYPHVIPNLMRKITTERSDVFKCRLVIGGDFNTTLDPELDAITVNSKHTKRRKRVKEFLRVVKLADVWREEHPGEQKYTYKFMSRLDYVFILKDEKCERSCEIHNEIVLSDHDLALSDHSPVSLTLNYTNDRRV